MPVILLLALLYGGPAAADSLAPAAPDPLPWRLRAVAVVVAQGDGRGQTLEPSGIAVDAFGRLVVADAALHRLQRFEPDGRWLGESGALGSDPGQLRRPGAVVLLGALTVAALDRENRRVEGYDLFGRRLGTLIDLLDPALADAVGRVDPVALAADRGGALYVADADRDRVLAFDFAGRFVRTLGGFGARPGSFRGLGGLATAPRGGLVTAERVNARVQRLDAAGRVAAAWPLAVARGPGALAVAVDDSGRVAVADEASGRLWLFDADGRDLAALAGLARPRALAFAPDGTLLVAEAARGEVRRFAIERAARATRED
ncbi:MAG: NHL repeat-containing protein [Candidatus Eisenbacteria bacterium]